MSSPDLFVVCKSCGAEVSPYITECPYCGNRLRKRAPRLDKPVKTPRASRRAPRVAREAKVRWGRPWGTISIVGLSIVATVVTTLSGTAAENTIYSGILGYDESWKLVTTLFVYGSDAFEVVVLGSVFLFGWLLERRHGAWAPILVFLLAGVAGTAAAVGLDDNATLLGAPGAAAGMVAAWSVPHLLARRRAEVDEDVDLLGVAVFAAVLILLPLVVYGTHEIEGVAGALVGLVVGLPLARTA